MKGAVDQGYDFILTNFANGDVIGHTSNSQAKLAAAATVSEYVGKVAEYAKANGYVVAVTADHGNIETLYNKEGKPHVAHTTNLVPFIVLDPKGRDKILGEIREYHEEKKNTILLVSHSMEDIAKNATMALVMNQSRLFCYDRVEAVFGRAGELGEMGLTIPQVSRVFLSLAEKGLDIDPRVYTVQAARDELLKKLGKGGQEK